jgi:hypothetical protein
MSRSLVVVIVVICVIFVITTWSLVEKRHVAQLFLNKLSTDLNASVEKTISALAKVQETKHLYDDCQTNYKDVARNAEVLRVTVSELQYKIKDLEKLIQQKVNVIQSLVQANPGDSASFDNPKAKNGVHSSLIPGCQLWTALTDVNSVNGMREYLFSTLTKCQDHCIALVTCVAVDFDKGSVPLPTCWIHINMTDLSDANTYAQIGTTQYRINRTCLSDSQKIDKPTTAPFKP